MQFMRSRVSGFIDVSSTMTRAFFRVTSGASRLVQGLGRVPRRCLFRDAEGAVSGLEAEFEANSVPEAALSAQHIVAKALGLKNLERLQSQGNGKGLQLTPDQNAQVERMKLCRLARMPVPYILGDWDFRELTLKMRPPVFIPRPETEDLVGHVLARIENSPERTGGGPINVLEIGCGSGAICLSLIKEAPKLATLNIVAIDQSMAACSLTLENALDLGIKVGQDDGVGSEGSLRVLHAKILRDGDEEGLAGEAAVPGFKVGVDLVEGGFDYIVSNPPYILRKDLAKLDPEIMLYEDLRALDGGKDGLGLITSILGLAGGSLLKPKGLVFLEVDPCHEFLLPSWLEANPSEAESIRIESVLKDFSGKSRFVVLEKKTLKSI